MTFPGIYVFIGIMKNVMIFGTFDHLHKGHRYFIQKAGEQGDKITAVVSTDQYVKDRKGKNPHDNQSLRQKKLLQSGLIDKVLPSDYPVGSWQVIDRERPDIICLGHDQTAMKNSLENWIEKRTDSYIPQIVQLAPFRRNRYSSSRISRKKGALLTFFLTIAMLFWGFSWVSGKIASHTAPPLVLLFWRFLISTTAFLPMALSERKNTGPVKGGIGWTLLSSLFLSLYNLMFFIGLSASLAGKGGVIVTTLVPIFTLLLSMIFYGKKLLVHEVAGLVLGLSGGVLLVQPWLIKISALTDGANLLFIAAAVLWAGLTQSSRRAQPLTGFFRFNFLVYLFSTAAALAAALLFNQHPFDFSRLSAAFWMNVLYLALIAGALATGVYFRAGVVLGASRGSSFTFLVPISALIFSRILLGEIPGLLTLTGSVLSCTGLFIINSNLFRKKQGEPS